MATVCLLSASTSASSMFPTCPPTGPSPASVQPEAIPDLHKPSYAAAMFQLHEAHVIIKLHDDQTCLLNCTFPYLAVCHFPPLPLKAPLMGTLAMPHNTAASTTAGLCQSWWLCTPLSPLLHLHCPPPVPQSPLPIPSALHCLHGFTFPTICYILHD